MYIHFYFACITVINSSDDYVNKFEAIGIEKVSIKTVYGLITLISDDILELRWFTNKIS